MSQHQRQREEVSQCARQHILVGDMLSSMRNWARQRRRQTTRSSFTLLPCSQSLSLEMEFLYAAWIVVHFCTVTLAEPPLSPLSLSLLNGVNVNLTAPSSLTQLFSSKWVVLCSSRQQARKRRAKMMTSVAASPKIPCSTPSPTLTKPSASTATAPPYAGETYSMFSSKPLAKSQRMGARTNLYPTG